jgi:hypothetical protein
MQTRRTSGLSDIRPAAVAPAATGICSRGDDKERSGSHSFATGFVVGYPPCTWIREFKSIVETSTKSRFCRYASHTAKIQSGSQQVDFWEKMEMEKLAPLLFNEKEEIMKLTTELHEFLM